MQDLLKRLLPADLGERIMQYKQVEAKQYTNVSIAVLEVADFQRLMDHSTPEQLVAVLNYLAKCIHAGIAQHEMKICEVHNVSNVYLVGK